MSPNSALWVAAAVVNTGVGCVVQSLEVLSGFRPYVELISATHSQLCVSKYGQKVLSEDEGSGVLGNVVTYLQSYMASRPRSE